MRTKLLRYGQLYTFTRITDSTLTNPTATQTAYKTKNKTTTTYTERAIVHPARAYDVHSNTYIINFEGGEEKKGIITVQLDHTTNVMEDDYITTADGKYKLMAKETYGELVLIEGHMEK